MSSCGYPDHEPQHRWLTDGMLLAGATVSGNGNNRHVQIGTTSEPLAEWLAEQLGWLCQGVRTEHQRGARATTYTVRTPAHPELNRYERWDHGGEASGRIAPESFDLTPPAGRVWYAFAGGLEWTQAYDSTRQVTFSALNDARREALAGVLDRAGFEPTVFDDRVRLRPSVAAEWLAWIGDPVPGVTHKWADSLIRYRALRATGTADESDPDYRAALARTALEVARERSDQELTADLFDRRVSAVSSAEVADILGGGSFEDAVSVAGVPPRRSTVGSGGEGGHPTKYSLDSLREAVQMALDAQEGSDLTIQAYQQYRANSDGALPSEGTIRARLGGRSWKEALDAVQNEADE